MVLIATLKDELTVPELKSEQAFSHACSTNGCECGFFLYFVYSCKRVTVMMRLSVLLSMSVSKDNNKFFVVFERRRRRR